MPRRMEIELTSSRDDGTFTWRASGAREPRGIVERNLVGGDAKVGDVVRVEAEFELDGITIVSVLPTRERHREVERIELAPPRPPVEPVTTSLVERRERPRRDRRGPGGGDRPPGERRDREERPAPSGEGGEGRGRWAAGAPRRTGDDRRPSERGPERPRRPEAPPRAGTERGGEGVGGRRPVRTARPTERERAAQQRPGRLVPGTAHRDELLASLPIEQRPIAEQLAAGGLPAVRRALAEQQSASRAEGRPVASGEAIVALAEQLLPGVKEAVWLDRAEAATARLEELTLRDLRAVVAGAAPRDEHGRELLHRLRESLDERVTKLRTTWEGDITRALDEGRVLQAVRLSARPPEPSARFPATLVTRLGEAASAGLSAETPPERWIALLEAAAASPVRHAIKPTGIPEDETGGARRAATLAAGRLPSLARLLGLAMPPPPRPLPGRPAGQGAGPRPLARPVPRPRPRADAPRQVPATSTETGHTGAPVTAEQPPEGATPGLPPEVSASAAPDAEAPEPVSSAHDGTAAEEESSTVEETVSPSGPAPAARTAPTSDLATEQGTPVAPGVPREEATTPAEGSLGAAVPGATEGSRAAHEGAGGVTVGGAGAAIRPDEAPAATDDLPATPSTGAGPDEVEAEVPGVSEADAAAYEDAGGAPVLDAATGTGHAPADTEEAAVAVRADGGPDPRDSAQPGDPPVAPEPAEERGGEPEGS